MIVQKMVFSPTDLTLLTKQSLTIFASNISNKQCFLYGPKLSVHDNSENVYRLLKSPNYPCEEQLAVLPA